MTEQGRQTEYAVVYVFMQYDVVTTFTFVGSTCFEFYPVFNE